MEIWKGLSQSKMILHMQYTSSESGKAIQQQRAITGMDIDIHAPPKYYGKDPRRIDCPIDARFIHPIMVTFMIHVA